MLRVQQLVDERVDAVLRLVAVHPDLLDHHLALLIDVRVAQQRRADHVRDDVEREEVVPRDHARPEDGDLLVRGRVHRAADALDGLADVLRERSLRGPLEHDVLEEVRGAGVGLVLDPRADADVDRERHGARLRHLRHEDAEAVREGDALVIHRDER
jgi:hypothetical protein